MKHIISLLVLSCCFYTLKGQEASKMYEHSLSLNIGSAFPYYGVALRPSQKALALIPGLEYRLRFDKRLTLRVGATFRPLQDWESGLFSRNYSVITFREFNVNSGIQFHFWKDELLPQFRMYALMETGASWVYEQKNFSLNIADELPPTQDPSTSFALNGALGLGFAFLLGKRLVIRHETSLLGSFNIRNYRDYNTGLPETIKYTTLNWAPVSELSIGWRF